MKKALKILRALADETRFKILELLLDGEKCVCEIFPYVKRKQSTVSIQLKKLESLGIVKSKRKGRKVFYSIKEYSVFNILKVLEYKRKNFSVGITLDG